MNSRELKLFLILQMIAVAWALLSFSLISSRQLAGALAGGYFLIAGAFMFKSAWRWSDKWNSPTFYALTAHLFGVSIPMLWVRFLNPGVGFNELQVMGLPGPLFHRVATAVFFILMLATIIDWLRARRAHF